MENNPEAIDLVYLWVDGSDPVWQAKRNALIGSVEKICLRIVKVVTPIMTN